MSIPKTIHYCWFGNKAKPQELKSCIDSWHMHLSDYEIIEWNHSNYSSESYFFNFCLENKKYAFASDFARFDILNRLGGIYLDIDMLMLKSLNPLLGEDCFLGYETEDVISCGIIASDKGHLFISEVANYLNAIHTSSYFESHNIVSVTNFIFNKCKNSNIDKLPKIFPKDYFYSYPYNTSGNPLSFITDNSFAVHLWNASWYSSIQRAMLLYNKGEKRKARFLFLKSLFQNPLHIRFLRKFIC